MRALVVGALLLAPVFAQTRNTEHTLRLDDGAARPSGKIESLAWLAGSWAGEGSIGTVEETWTPPSHGTMVGAFKAVRDGEVLFYELCEIAEEGGSLTYRVKHFGPDLKGWEDKDEHVTFPLVDVGEGVVHFSGLTYRLLDENALSVHVATRGKEGTNGELEFLLRRRD